MQGSGEPVEAGRMEPGVASRRWREDGIEKYEPVLSGGLSWAFGGGYSGGARAMDRGGSLPDGSDGQGTRRGRWARVEELSAARRGAADPAPRQCPDRLSAPR